MERAVDLKERIKLGWDREQVRAVLGNPYVEGRELTAPSGKYAGVPISIWIYMERSEPRNALRILFEHGLVVMVYTELNLHETG